MKRNDAQSLMNVAFAATLILLTFIAARASAADPAPQLIAQGKAIVTERCAICHATGPLGASPNPAAPPLRKLSERYPGPALDEAFEMGVLERHPGMPSFRFDHEELAALLAYLRSIQEIRGA